MMINEVYARGAIGCLAIFGLAVLAGCASQNGIPTTTLSAAAAAELQAAANSYCPVLTAVQTETSANPSLSTTDISKAEQVLAEVCPPNPLPTNGVVVAIDLINAYLTLEPILPKATAMAARARFDKADAKYHLRAKYHLNIPVS